MLLLVGHINGALGWLDVQPKEWCPKINSGFLARSTLDAQCAWPLPCLSKSLDRGRPSRKCHLFPCQGSVMKVGREALSWSRHLTPNSRGGILGRLTSYIFNPCSRSYIQHHRAGLIQLRVLSNSIAWLVIRPIDSEGIIYHLFVPSPVLPYLIVRPIYM